MLYESFSTTLRRGEPGGEALESAAEGHVQTVGEEGNVVIERVLVDDPIHPQKIRQRTAPVPLPMQPPLASGRKPLLTSKDGAIYKPSAHEAGDAFIAEVDRLGHALTKLRSTEEELLPWPADVPHLTPDLLQLAGIEDRAACDLMRFAQSFLLLHETCHATKRAAGAAERSSALLEQVCKGAVSAAGDPGRVNPISAGCVPPSMTY